ncbi:MAG: zinc ABC transporter substrate-binding protein, partial [Pirellulales bacterium]
MNCRLLVVILLGGLGCSAQSSDAPARQDSAAEDSRYKIVTTTAMVTDIVRQVSGDRANVEGLMGTGVDPHLFRPATSDHAKLYAADIIFYSGLMLEGGLDAVLKKAGARGKPAFAVTEEIDPDYIEYSAQFAGHPDPHVWNDVSAWSECVAFVALKLSEFDPPHADEYRENAERYRAELAELHAYARQVI